jgi:hypothetical protein
VFDPKRKRIVSWPYSNAAASFAVTLDFPSRALHAPPSGSLQSYYTLANYMAADDKYLVARLQPFNGVWQMEVVDPDNLANKVQTKQTGPMPPAGVLTFTWDESRRQWVGWDSADANLWICQAPADPVNGTWVWSQRPYTAQDTIVKQTGVNHMFNRLHYINALDSFICIARVDGPIQFWKA